ncbi:hypothetical protein ACHAXM_004388 [Skeletonema potamos]
MKNTISYDSSTNKRLRNPSHAQSLAQDAVQNYCNNNPSASILVQNQEYRTIIGLGPGRSGTKSLCELLSYQTNVVHCEHEMIVPRLFPRSTSGHIVAYTSTSIPTTASASGRWEGGKTYEIDGDVHQQNQNNQKFQSRKPQVKGSWGADRRLEWDVPKLARGEPSRSDEDEALWRLLRLIEQRHVFDGWMKDYNNHGPKCDIAADTGNSDGGKPKKLGTIRWREYNAKNCYDINHHSSSNDSNECKLKATQQRKQMHPANNENEECNMNNPKSNNTNQSHTLEPSIPVIATVSSVGLAYTHEYVALNSTVKILILLRPCEEVVSSFMTKSRGRNHWQKHTHGRKKRNKMDEAMQNKAENHDNTERVKVQRDKTWDGAFPNMSNDECYLVMSTNTVENTSSTPTSSNEQRGRPEKIWAIRAYCKLYSEVANQLSKQYPDNVRVCDMHSVLNDADVQVEMLQWCGFGEPVVDTRLHLNKKK